MDFEEHNDLVLLPVQETRADSRGSTSQPRIIVEMQDARLVVT